MKTLERNEERLKLKSDLNSSISIFMLIALGALIVTLLSFTLIFVLNYINDPTTQVRNVLVITEEQEIYLIILGMVAFGTLVTAAFTPLTTEYEIERSSMLFRIKTYHFLNILDEVQEIPLRDIKRVETQRNGGQGSIHLILDDRSINISSDVEIPEEKALEITDSIVAFVRNR